MNVRRAEHTEPIPDADETLDAALISFSSGNQCTVTPCMKRIEDGRCRILVLYVWDHEPSPKDVEDANEFVDMATGTSAAGVNPASKRFSTSTMPVSSGKKLLKRYLTSREEPTPPVS